MEIKYWLQPAPKMQRIFIRCFSKMMQTIRIAANNNFDQEFQLVTCQHYVVTLLDCRNNCYWGCLRISVHWDIKSSSQYSIKTEWRYFAFVPFFAVFDFLLSAPMQFSIVPYVPYFEWKNAMLSSNMDISVISWHLVHFHNSNQLNYPLHQHFQVFNANANANKNENANHAIECQTKMKRSCMKCGDICHHYGDKVHWSFESKKHPHM